MARSTRKNKGRNSSGYSLSDTRTSNGSLISSQNQNLSQSLSSISDNLIVFNRATVDFPLPVKSGKPSTGKDFIPFGANNLWPQDLADVFKKSKTLKAVISSKADYVSGKGINSNSDLIKVKLEEDFNNEYDYMEFSRRCSIDYELTGECYFEEVRKGDSSFAYHIDRTQVRYKAFDYKNFSKPYSVLISTDWRNYRKPEHGPKEIAIYPNWTEIDGTKRRIHCIKDYEIGSRFYGYPNWIGAYYDALLESNLPLFNLNFIENGIHLSGILFWNFGENAKIDYLKGMKEKIEGELKGVSGGNTGKVLVVPVSGGVDEPKYISYPLPPDGSFEKLSKTTENNIISACNWYRSLAGLETEGKLGNNQQMRIEYEVGMAQIKRFQNRLKRAYWRTLEGTRYYNSDDFTVLNDPPTNVINDLDSKDIAKVIKFGQVQEWLGLPVDEDRADVYLSDIKDNSNENGRQSGEG